MTTLPKLTVKLSERPQKIKGDVGCSNTMTTQQKLRCRKCRLTWTCKCSMPLLEIPQHTCCGTTACRQPEYLQEHPKNGTHKCTNIIGDLTQISWLPEEHILVLCQSSEHAYTLTHMCHERLTHNIWQHYWNWCLFWYEALAHSWYLTASFYFYSQLHPYVWHQHHVMLWSCILP